MMKYNDDVNDDELNSTIETCEQIRKYNKKLLATCLMFAHNSLNTIITNDN